MQLQALLAALEQPPLKVHPSGDIAQNLEVTALAYDSRLVQVGSMFIAVPGTHTDGRRFLVDAVQRGAVVALGPPLAGATLSALPLPYIEVGDVRTALADLACAFYQYP